MDTVKTTVNGIQAVTGISGLITGTLCKVATNKKYILANLLN